MMDDDDDDDDNDDDDDDDDIIKLSDLSAGVHPLLWYSEIFKCLIIWPNFRRVLIFG